MASARPTSVRRRVRWTASRPWSTPAGIPVSPMSAARPHAATAPAVRARTAPSARRTVASVQWWTPAVPPTAVCGDAVTSGATLARRVRRVRETAVRATPASYQETAAVGVETVSAMSSSRARRVRETVEHARCPTQGAPRIPGSGDVAMGCVQAVRTACRVRKIVERAQRARRARRRCHARLDSAAVSASVTVRGRVHRRRRPVAI